MTTIEVTVPEELDGERADKVLAAALDTPRSAVKEIIENGDATVASALIKPSQKMRAGTVILATLPEPSKELIPDPEVPFVVVHEDGSILVVDKPAGVVVHPGSGRTSGTLVNGLIARYPDLVGVGQEDRWGIVHRLDRDTSGLLVVARTQQDYETLIDMMKAREVARRYLSVVQGGFTNTIGTIDAPIGRDPQNPTHMHLSRSGKAARTHYRRIARWTGRDATMLSVTLETGRTHQIRVHLRSIGHQILGDHIYGKRGVIGDPGRTWLHARHLGFRHPGTGEELSFTSPLPDDLTGSLAELGEPDLGTVVDINGEPL
ncbi:MAG: RluA family pseudouridine synthase [Acidimicrobiia bacterium]|nr:MAG: RluA family pseudouridine synthase [Acidimicrobiia bacterium]